MAVRDEAEARLRTINSKQNALVKDLRKAFSQAELTSDGYMAIEGVRIIEDAIRSGLRFHAIFFSETGRVHLKRLLPQISSQTETLLLPDEVFSSAVATQTPQGIAALVKPKNVHFEEILREPVEDVLILGLAGVQDPGNVGTVIRSAEAFSARAVLLGEKTVSPFNSKVVRASAGSVFRQPVIRMALKESIARLREKNVRIVAASSHEGTPLDEMSLAGPLALLIGNEGAGLPTTITSEADELVTIPHSPRVESLNAGIAASILLYEAARQRRTAGSAE